MPTKTTVFISRFLQTDSPLLSVLANTRFQVDGQSLLRFHPIPFTTFPATDWIFFYSKNAVDFFINQAAEWPTTVQLAAMGTGTANAIQAHGLAVHFVGDGRGATTATAFYKQAKGQTVLFPQARHSRQTIQKILGQQLEMYSLVVYDNRFIDDIPKIDADLLVFTSPLNAKAYFDHHQLTDHQRVLAIGPTTAKLLQHLGITEVYVAEEASEMGVVQKILELNYGEGE